VALSSPAADRRCGTWQWLVVKSSAKQNQQLHHQQLTNGSTILKTFMFPEFLDLFKLLSTVWYHLVWATKLLLASIGLVFPALVLGYKSFHCSMYHVPVPTLIEKFV
jgi:hypothetical protein